MLQPIKTPADLAGNPPNLKPYFKTEISYLGKNCVVSDPKALRALVAIMDMNAVIGGAASHFGGPSAFAEIVSAVYAIAFEAGVNQSKPWHQCFNIVNDAGHCENVHYAVKANYQFADLSFSDLWKFRSIESPLTGHGENHLFPQGVLLSNGPLGSACPQSQGLALADHMTGNSRVTLAMISDGGVMEGEAKEALAAIPGFAKKGELAPYILIISDNNTKLTGRIDQDSFSLEPTFESLSILGWDVIKLDQGNNLEKCYQSINEAIAKATSNPKKPVAIWAKTVKGIGHKASEESSSGGHGFSLKSATDLSSFVTEVFQGDSVPAEISKWVEATLKREMDLKANKSASGPVYPELSAKSDKVQVGVAKAMINMAKKGVPIISVTSDLPGSTGVAAFRKEFPKQSIDVGVAESNMISVAAGLSKSGFIPVVDTFAQFGVTKGALPLIMSALSQAPVVGVFSHIGFQDAADGASHQALNYLAMTTGIPHTEVWSLSCAAEAEALMSQAFEEFYQLRSLGKVPPSYLFFLGRENFPLEYKPGTAYKLREHNVVLDFSTGADTDIMICPMGTLVPEAIKAAYQLKEQGVGSIVLHPGYLSSPNWGQLRPWLQKVGNRVLFIEDHQKIGGFASNWALSALEQGIGLKAKVLAVEGKFGQSAYSARELYQAHGMDASAIIRAANFK